MPVYGPRHDLQQSAVNRCQITIVGDIASAIRVQFVEVVTGPHDSHEGAEVIAAFGVASVIWRQVPRNDIRAESGAGEQRAIRVLDNSRSHGAEVLSAVQVSRLVVLCRTIIGPAELRIVRRQIFVSRIRPMAAVAVRLAVNDEATQSHQFWILAGNVDEVRRDA